MSSGPCLEASRTLIRSLPLVRLFHVQHSCLLVPNLPQLSHCHSLCTHQLVSCSVCRLAALPFLFYSVGAVAMSLTGSSESLALSRPEGTSTISYWLGRELGVSVCPTAITCFPFRRQSPSDRPSPTSALVDSQTVTTHTSSLVTSVLADCQSSTAHVVSSVV